MKPMMKQSEVHPMRLLAGAFCVAMLLCGTVSAQQTGMAAPMAGVLGTNPAANPATQPVLPKQATTEARAKSVASERVASSPASIGLPGVVGMGKDQTQASHPAKMGDEGLKMHGHWVIDVRNPDGTLAEHRDFENSIQFGGQAYLIGLLAGYVVPSDYAIDLVSNSATNPPCTANGTEACFIVRSLSTSPGNFACPIGACSANLTYTFNQSSGANSSMVLAGSIMANQAGVIGAVATLAGGCPSTATQTSLATVSPATCNASTAIPLSVIVVTATNLAAPINVVSGQLIQVTVTISFS